VKILGVPNPQEPPWRRCCFHTKLIHVLGQPVEGSKKYIRILATKSSLVGDEIQPRYIFIFKEYTIQYNLKRCFVKSVLQDECDCATALAYRRSKWCL